VPQAELYMFYGSVHQSPCNAHLEGALILQKLLFDVSLDESPLHLSRLVWHVLYTHKRMIKRNNECALVKTVRHDKSWLGIK
jgi:hypothetical protein